MRNAFIYEILSETHSITSNVITAGGFSCFPVDFPVRPYVSDDQISAAPAIKAIITRCDYR